MRFLQVIGSLVVLACLVGAQVASAGTVTYYHADLLGSPIAATNSSGQVIWRENYRPYGERLTNDASSSANQLWYTSRRQDAETGLVYMGARYYDPVVGRFMGADAIRFDQTNVHSFNRYAYANNNPYRYLDPDGYQAASVLRLVVPFIFGGAAIDAARDRKKVEASEDAVRRLFGVHGLLSESSEESSGAQDKKGEQPKAKPDREQKPDDVPTNTKPIDQDKRVDRGLLHDVKKGLGAKDWVGVDPDGNIWINEGGKASLWGHLDQFDRSDKKRD